MNIDGTISYQNTAKDQNMAKDSARVELTKCSSEPLHCVKD